MHGRVVKYYDSVYLIVDKFNIKCVMSQSKIGLTIEAMVKKIGFTEISELFRSFFKCLKSEDKVEKNVIFSDKWDLLIYLMHLKNSSKFLNKDL
jgi:hypothetical protein